LTKWEDDLHSALNATDCLAFYTRLLLQG